MKILICILAPVPAWLRCWWRTKSITSSRVETWDFPANIHLISGFVYYYFHRAISAPLTANAIKRSIYQWTQRMWQFHRGFFMRRQTNEMWATRSHLAHSIYDWQNDTISRFDKAITFEVKHTIPVDLLSRFVLFKMSKTKIRNRLSFKCVRSSHAKMSDIPTDISSHK